MIASTTSLAEYDMPKSLPSMPNIGVLGLIEDDQWCAIALEMSLRGYGASFDDALRDLKDAIRAQVTFALENGTIDKIFMRAEQKYLDLYATVIKLPPGTLP